MDIQKRRKGRLINSIPALSSRKTLLSAYSLYIMLPKCGQRRNTLHIRRLSQQYIARWHSRLDLVTDMHSHVIFINEGVRFRGFRQTGSPSEV